MTFDQAEQLLEVMGELRTAADAIAWLLIVIALACCWLLGGCVVRLLFLFKNQRRFW